MKNQYSTTKNLTRDPPKILYNPDDKFQSFLFWSDNQKQIKEGGLRKKGYFKKSYKNKPLITIVTAVFNGDAYLEETILSVLHQTYDNIEYIIIDGGSTDNSLNIIKKYDHIIDYWISEKDTGIYSAWNKAIYCTQGDWVSFLGADDYFESNAISKMSSLTNNNFDYISAKVRLIKNNRQPIRIIGSKWNWNKYSRFMNVAHVGSLHHISLFKQKGGVFNSNFKICGDYEFLLRFGPHLKAGYVDEIIANMRIGGNSDSGSYKIFKETFEAKRLNKSRKNILNHYDTYWAILKNKIRRLIWY